MNYQLCPQVLLLIRENYNSTNQSYTPTVKDVTAIITLPFSKDSFFLAAALEVYLIQKLEPPRNKMHSRNK
ncbi:MAG: hypothetical protein ACI9OE_002366 [Mariniflexile sp.]|jgi:hypothetical protein